MRRKPQADAGLFRGCDGQTTVATDLSQSESSPRAALDLWPPLEPGAFRFAGPQVSVVGEYPRAGSSDLRSAIHTLYRLVHKEGARDNTTHTWLQVPVRTLMVRHLLVALPP